MTSMVAQALSRTVRDFSSDLEFTTFSLERDVATNGRSIVEIDVSLDRSLVRIDGAIVPTRRSGGGHEPQTGAKDRLAKFMNFTVFFRLCRQT